MKQLFSVIVALFMVIGNYHISPAAAEKPVIFITANQGTVQVGDTFTVKVQAKNMEQFRGIQYNLAFNNTLVEVEDIKTAEDVKALNDNLFTMTDVGESGINHTITSIEEKYLSESSFEVAEITFKAIGAGNVTLQFEETDTIPNEKGIILYNKDGKVNLDDFTTTGRTVSITTASQNGGGTSSESTEETGGIGGSGSPTYGGEVLKSEDVSIIPSSEIEEMKNGIKADIFATKGGVLSYGDQIQLLVPANAINENIKVNILEIKEEDIQPFPNTFTKLSDAYDLSVSGTSGTHQFNQPVTLTFKLDKPFNLGRPAVYYFSQDRGEWIYVGGTYNKEANSITVSVNHFTPFAVFADSSLVSFKDVPTTHWAYSAITRLSGMKIINGVGQDLFAPEKPVTRAQFAKMLAMTLDLEEENAHVVFSDENEIPTWAIHSVQSLAAKGFVSGVPNGDGTVAFKPNQQLSRTEMAVILARALNLSGYHELAFTDTDEIPEWGQAGVAATVEAGLMNGMPNQLFGPKQQTTRAQTAAVMMRIFNELGL